MVNNYNENDRAMERRSQGQGQGQGHAGGAVADAADARRRDPEQNGMNEYERRAEEWNHSNYVQRRREERTLAINNTDGYHFGYRVHTIRSIQVPDYETWNQLFGREILNPTLRNYAQASIDYVQDATNTLPFAGQMEVSLIMAENYRPGVHVAVFIVTLSPHQQFHDGHVIQMEFGEGSQRHQIVNRLFDPNEYAVVSQATEYSILHTVADDEEMLDLLHMCFIDRDFQTMRFAYHGNGNDYDGGYYIADQDYQGQHPWHNDFMSQEPEEPPAAAVAEEEEADVQLVRIPPPPPVNDFARIYYNNIIQYNDIDDDYNENEERHLRDRLPAQG